MKVMRSFRIIFLFVLLVIVRNSHPVTADSDYTYFKPITNIDLGVNTLELNVGDSYSFNLILSCPSAGSYGVTYARNHIRAWRVEP